MWFPLTSVACPIYGGAVYMKYRTVLKAPVYSKVSVMHTIFTRVSYFECKLYIEYVYYVLFTLYLRIDCRGLW
jgi:hypothetical protein